jgi:hypothetical protein
LQVDSLSHSLGNAEHVEIPSEDVVRPGGNRHHGRALHGFGAQDLRHLRVAKLPASGGSDGRIRKGNLLFLSEHTVVVQLVNISPGNRQSTGTGGNAVAHAHVVARLWKGDLGGGGGS